MSELLQPLKITRKHQEFLSRKEIKQRGFLLDCTNVKSKKLHNYNSKTDKHMENFYTYQPKFARRKPRQKSDTDRVWLPKLARQNSITHAQLQGFLDMKALQTSQDFNSEGKWKDRL